VAVVNGPEARSLKLPLSFLGEGEYRALVVRDQADDPAAVRIEHTTARRADTAAAELSAGGGSIARYSRK
jgi:alpha-glucosidase